MRSILLRSARNKNPGWRKPSSCDRSPPNQNTNTIQVASTFNTNINILPLPDLIQVKTSMMVTVFSLKCSWRSYCYPKIPVFIPALCAARFNGRSVLAREFNKWRQLRVIRGRCAHNTAYMCYTMCYTNKQYIKTAHMGMTKRGLASKGIQKSI